MLRLWAAFYHSNTTMTSNSFIQRTVKFGIVALLPLFTVLYNPFSVDPVLSTRMAFLSVVGILGCLAIVLLLRGSSSPIKVQVNKPWLVVGLLFSVLSIASLFWATSFSEALFDINRTVLMYAVVILLSLLSVLVEQFWRYVLVGLWISAWLLLAWGAIELAMVFSSLSIESVELYRVTANMAHKNLLASAYLLLMPYVAYMFFTKQGVWKISSFVLLAGLIAMVVLLQGRSAWVGLVAMFVVAFIAMFLVNKFNISSIWKAVKPERYYLVTILLGCILMLGTIAVKKPDTFNYMLRKVSSMADHSGDRDQNKETIHERYALWDNTWQMIEEQPFKGVGAGSWKLQYAKYGLQGLRSENGYTLFQRPHNDLLWVWSELGIVGLLLYLLLFGLPLLVAFKFLVSKHNRESKLLVALAAIVLVGYLVVGLFSFPRERVFHNLLVFLSIAVILQHTSCSIDLRNITLYLYVAPLFAVFSWVLMASGYRVIGEWHTVGIYKAYGNQGMQEQMIREAEKASSIFYQMDPTATPLSWYKGIVFYENREYANARDQFSEGLQQSPYHLHLINNLGSCYEKLGLRDSAIITYQRGLKISPNYTDGLLNLSAVYYNNGDLAQAYQTILKCSTETQHPNYSVYLQAILKAKVYQLAMSSSTEQQKEALLGLSQNKAALVPIFKEAKAADISFEAALLSMQTQ